MRVLIAGYGNIGKAVHALIKSVNKTSVTSIEICDKDIHGITVQQWLDSNHDKVDTVLNLTGHGSESILAYCQKYGLNYIDTGFDLADDDPRNLAAAFQEFRSTPVNITALVGFGMNPGIIEYIYHRAAPQKPHIAIELEYDTASWCKKEIFNTWSPLYYFMEAVNYSPYFYRKDEKVCFLSSAGIDIEIPLKVDGTNRIFNLIPHEEIVTMGASNKYCEFCAFFYQAPVAIQSFLKNNGNTLDCETVKKIPVPGNGLEGEDISGMLIDDGSAYLTYHFTKFSHAKCLADFKDVNNKGISATALQVASGVYIAIESLPYIGPGIYTMTDIAQRISPYIEKALNEINLPLEFRKFHVDEIKWDRNIVKDLMNQPSLD